MNPNTPHNRQRRQLLLATAGALAYLGPASAAVPPATQAAMDAFTQGAPVSDGGLQLKISELVENGNLVPVTVQVDSPMTDTDHVRAIALFTERNPQPEVAVFHLSPALGQARVSTRLRLATSQTVTALALLSDGRCLRQRVGVIVTLAACVEG
jgi:sulfur-oxidizing protein SoxY